jgi:hypothetical protein
MRCSTVADWKSLIHGMTELGVVAIRSFCGTMLLMLCVGAALAAGAYYLLAQHQPWYGVVGGLVAMLEAAVVGLVWAGKRAALMALVQGVKKYRIGKASVRLIFERVLGVEGQRRFGERDGVVTSALERVPLAQAERRLGAAVQDVLDGPDESGGVVNWAKRWLRGRLLRYVEALTLARFRASGTEQGGLDLLEVRADLEERLDEALAARLKRALRLWTVLVLLGLPTQVFATVYIVIALLK